MSAKIPLRIESSSGRLLQDPGDHPAFSQKSFYFLSKQTHTKKPISLSLKQKQTNMPTTFGINGFGRIGRLVMRAALDNPGKDEEEEEEEER